MAKYRCAIVVGRPKDARPTIFSGIDAKFDSDTSRFKPCSTVLLWHNIVAKMVLDSCVKFYLEHSWWFYVDPIPSNILPEKNSHFSAFSFLWLTFSWGFHTYMLTINRAGSVSKTSDTWRKYRYLLPTLKYRQYRYLVSVSCTSLGRPLNPKPKDRFFPSLTI